MAMRGLRHTLALVLLVVTSSALGCATADQRVDFMYEATGVAGGGFGEFSLARDIQPSSGNEWVLGEITGKDGKKVGEIVSGIAPADEIRDAYMQELEAAGYAVRLVPALTQNVMKGARIVSAALRLDEKKHFFTTEAACTLKLTLEPWRNGSAMNRLRFVAVHTESALAGGEPLLEGVLQRTLHDVLTRSVPEIVKIVEQK